MGHPLRHCGGKNLLCAVLSGSVQKQRRSFSFRKAIAIWDGGLAIYGAVIAVVIVGICISRHKGYKLGAMLDLAVMGLLIGQCIGRWGNFMNREPSVPRPPCPGGCS